MLDPEAEVVCVGSSTYTHTLLTHTATAKSPAPHGALSANFRVYLVRKKKKKKKKEFLAHYNYRLTSFEKEKNLKKSAKTPPSQGASFVVCSKLVLLNLGLWERASGGRENVIVGSCVGPIF